MLQAHEAEPQEIRALVQTRVQGPPPSAMEVETKATKDLNGKGACMCPCMMGRRAPLSLSMASYRGATERFKQMTGAQIREFLFYVGAVMTWVESKGFSICDIGPSNLAVNPSSSFPPRLFLCDLQDWYQGGAQRKKGFSGLLRLAYHVCPEAEPTLNKIWSGIRHHYPKRFAAFSAEAPAYRQLLQLQRCTVWSGALATSFNSGC